MRWHGRIGPPTRRETSSKATCTVCGDNGSARCLVGEGGPRDRGRTAVIASLGHIGQPAIARCALVTGGRLERVPNAAKVQKSTNWGIKSHASLSLLCLEGKKERRRRTSAPFCKTN